MATGSHNLNEYYGVFNARNQGHIETVSSSTAEQLTKTAFGTGFFDKPLPFAQFNPRLPVYHLTDRVERLTFDGTRFAINELPEKVTASTIKDITIIFSHLNSLFKTAAENYKSAIRSNSKNLEALHEAYSKSYISLLTLCKKYESSEMIQDNDAYATAVNYLTQDYKEDTLFNVPEMQQLGAVPNQTRAKNALENYRQRIDYFNQGGRFASDSFKRLFLAESVYALNEAIDGLDPVDKHSFIATYMNDPNELADYQVHRITYLERMSTNQFNYEAMKYLFDRSQKNPSDQLRRQAFLDPAQRAELKRLTDLKQKALAQPQAPDFYKYPTRFLSDAFWASLSAVDALRYGTHKNADDIVLDAFRQSNTTWFTSRPLGAFYEENDAQLLLLTEQEETTAEALYAKQQAVIELAHRVHDGAQRAWTKTSKDKPLSIQARVYHADEAKDRATNLIHLRHVHDALEDIDDGVFGRLDILARLNYLYPSGVWKLLPGTSASQLYSNYEATQKLLVGPLIGSSLTSALQKAIQLSEKEIQASGLTDMEQKGLLYDDYSFLLRFIPDYQTTETYSGRTITATQDHPDLDRALGLGGLKGLKDTLSAKKEALRSEITRTNAAANRPVILTSDVLLNQFTSLSNTLEALRAPDATDFDKKSFEKNKKALLQYLDNQQTTAERIFHQTFEPDMEKRNTYYENILKELNKIEDYIVKLESSIDESRNLQTAIDNARKKLTDAKGWTGLWKADIEAAQEELNKALEDLNIPCPLAERKFKLPLVLEAYKVGK